MPLAGTIGGGLILAGTNPPRSCRRGGRGWHCWVLVAAVFSGAANLAVAASLSVTLIRETISTQRALISTLEKVLSSSDVLLALPDPEAFNRTTAQSIFLTSYRYRDPVLGYSRSLTRAGARLSLHSSPAQVGRQAAEWIASALQDSPVRLPAASHPAYFSVSVNDQVARSLGWVLPAEDELVRKLGGEP